MKKLITFILILSATLLNAQASSKMNNSQNVTQVNYDPPMLVGALPSPDGLWQCYDKDSIHWDYTQIVGLSARIKTVADPLYKPYTYSPSYSEISGGLGYIPYNSSNPSGFISFVPAQSFSSLVGKPNTLAGYGITDGYPATGNPSGFLTGYTETDPLFDTKFSGKNTSNLVEGGGKLYYTDSRARGAISLTVTGTGAATFDPVSGVFNIPTPVSQYTPTSVTVTRPVNSTTYTISSTKEASVRYNIKISCTATIGSASSGKVVFQYSVNGGSTWIDAGEVENSNTVTLAIALNSITIQTGFIVWDGIPANALCRMVSATSGTTTITYVRGQEKY